VTLFTRLCCGGAVPISSTIDYRGVSVSNEGVTATSRVVLVIVLTIATAFVRVLVGLRRRRGLYVGLGTLGGISSGVAVASALSPSNTTDVSVMAACLGIFAGWGAACLFARMLLASAMTVRGIPVL
jgi:hypothetical protein